MADGWRDPQIDAAGFHAGAGARWRSPLGLRYDPRLIDGSGLMTPDDRDSMVSEIVEVCRKVKNFNIEAELVREKEFGTSGFVHFREIFENCIKTVGYIDDQKRLNSLPDPILNDAKSQLESLERALTQIRDYRGEQQSGSRDAFVSNFMNAYSELLRILPVFVALGDDSDANREAVRKAREAAERDAKEAREVLAGMREASHATGVTAHSGAFGQATKDSRSSMIRWLCTSAVLALATGVYVLWGILRPPEITDLGSTAHLAFRQLALFSLAFYATSQAVKSYRGHAHNYIINKRKRDALVTFQAFVSAASAEAVRDAVLMRSTENIFSHQTTGFESSPADSTSPPLTANVVNRLVDKQQ